jgi:hypothetical protein
VFDLGQAAPSGTLDASGYGMSIVCQNGCDEPTPGAHSTTVQLCRSNSECPDADVCYALPSTGGASIGGTQGCVPSAWVTDAGFNPVVDAGGE